MSNTRLVVCASLVTMLLSPAIYADQGDSNDAGKTRAEVKAELADAVRNGDIAAPGQSGRTMREVWPSRYPAAPVVAGKTREQVETELANAVRTGDIYVGDSGLKANELWPQRYESFSTPMYAASRDKTSTVN